MPRSLSAAAAATAAAWLVGPALLLSAPAGAAVFADAEGVASSGLNDTLETAQDLGVLPRSGDSLTVNGFVDATNPNDVDFYRFEVVGGTLGVFFDVDLANDIGSTSDLDTGLDAALAVFDAAGSLVGYDEDSDFFERGTDNAGTDPGSDPFGDYDPFIGELTLAEGSWLVAVAYYLNEPLALPKDPATGGTPLSFSGFSYSGFAPEAGFELDRDPLDFDSDETGTYRLDVRTTFLEVPEPATAAALAAGSALLLGRRRPAGGLRRG